MTAIAFFEVPGTSHKLWYERSDTGRLLRLWSGDCVYLSDDGAGRRTLGDGLAIVREMALPRGVLRHVDACGESWIEEYSWDEAGRPVLVDGMRIERDGRHRVTACRDGGETWRYGYLGDDLAVMDTPRGARYVTRGDSGRPVIVRERERVEQIAYDHDGTRIAVAPLPQTWHRDELGRLWTVCAAGGSVTETYLWDGFACLGRIDGEPGQPLAACYSLDPSCTPVRVITRGGVTRVPRDAFGEGLLAHRGVPGLYGGAIHDGFVHLRSRTIDPRCGSFDRLDPFHGRADDPRRAGGYGGSLLIETAASGPYAVSQYDPVGRVDPTGEIDVLSILLDPTWALQNNLAGWFGLDWSIGWWLDWVVSFGQIFACMAGDRPESFLKRFFDYEPLYNERTHHWAIRRGFFDNERAFTFQHILVASHESFEDLEQSNVIDPKGVFAPTCYGTILRAEPAGADPFLLRGNGDATLVQWTRHGGPAVAVSPGSPVPRFPSGGLHLAQTRPERGPLPCKLTELVPSGAPVAASLAPSVVVTSVPPGTKLAPGSKVVLTDAGNNAQIMTVLDQTGTKVRFQEPGTTIAMNNVRLRSLGPPTSETKPVNAVAAAPGRLSTDGTTLNYAPGDVLQLLQGGFVAGAIVVQGFETGINLDGPLPSTPFPLLIAAIEVRIAIAGGMTTPGSMSIVDGVAKLTTSTAPAGPIAITGSMSAIGTFATPTGKQNEYQLDQAPQVLKQLGVDDAAGVTWQELFQTGVIGKAMTTDTTASFRYAPTTIRSALPAGFIVIRHLSFPPWSSARGFTLQYDAIVSASGALPPSVDLPYQVVQFTPAGVDVAGLTLSTEIGLPVGGGAVLAGTSLQIYPLASAALTAGDQKPAQAMTVQGSTMKVSQEQAANLSPSQLVVLGDGVTVEANVVSKITAKVTLDRTIVFTTGAVLDAVRLAPDGPIWNATFVSDHSATVLPTVGSNSDPKTTTFVQLPRFEVGAFVVVTPAQGTGLHFLVASVSGSTLVLTEGPSIDKGDLTVQLIVPVAPDPPNDTWRIGLRGATVGGNVVAKVTETDTISIDIWNTGHWKAEALVGLIEINPAGVGVRPHIAVVSKVSYTVTFVTPPTITDVLTVTPVSTSPFYAATFKPSGATVGAVPAGMNPLVVVPYAPAASPIVAPDGELGPGTVLVPVDPDKFDITRKKSLVFHELTHTRQALKSGPLFWGYIPLFVLEGPIEWLIGSDVGMLEYTKYIDATLVSVNGMYVLDVPHGASIGLAEGSRVQFSQAGDAARVLTLGKPAGTMFPFAGHIGFAEPGGVQVRRIAGKKRAVIDGFLDVFGILTLGGLCNLAATLTWGGIIRLAGNLGYTIGHGIFHSGTEYKATVSDSRTITMNDDDGRRAVQGFRRVFLRAGDMTELYEVESTEDEKITLTKATPFTGDVGVKPYDTPDWVDGLAYWNASVPDSSKPAQIRIEQRGGKSLELKPFDRVSIAAGKMTSRTNVIAVTGDLVDLQDAPVTFGFAGLRIAYMDAGDPIGSLDSKLMAEMGDGWMRWFFDPYGQLPYGLDPSHWFLKALTLAARYAFGNHSWSGVILGHLFNDDVWHQVGDEDVKGNGAGQAISSPMEQEAAEESGNLYTSLAKLHGDIKIPDADSPALATANVGDIGRFWCSPSWSRAKDQPLLLAPAFDAPDVAVNNIIVAVPSIGSEDGGTALNAGIKTTSKRPGTFLPDVFYPKQVFYPEGHVDPDPDPEERDAATSTDKPKGYRPGARGLIPVSPTVELSIGAYVAFNQPGLHRITVDDSLSDADNVRQVHLNKKQTIFFDVQVSDIDVRLAGLPIPQTVPPHEVTLILTQQAHLSTSGAGTFVMTPTAGVAVSVSRKGVLEATAVGKEFVEVSRFYPATGSPPAYTDGVLSLHNVHLPVDVHVPVRLIHVIVADTLIMTAAAARGSEPLKSVKPGGTAFAFVPANVRKAMMKTGVVYASGKPLIDPNLVPLPVTPSPDDAVALPPGGRVFRVDFPADDPPESAATITFTTIVGTTDNPKPLKATITLNPHFTLTAPSLQVSLSAPDPVLVLNAGTVNVTNPAIKAGDPMGIAFAPPPKGPNLSITVTHTTQPGKRQILVTDAADATHMAAITIEVIA